MIFPVVLLLFSSRASAGGLPDSVRIKGWLEQSRTYLSKNFDQAKLFADSALMLARESGDSLQMYKAFERLADAGQASGDYHKSFDYYASVYAYLNRNGKRSEAARILNRMGESKRLADDYHSALKYFQQSIKIHREEKDTNEVGSCLISIGVMYAVKGDIREAEKYFLEAIGVFRSIRNYNREHLTLLNMGGMYRESGQYEKSIECSKKAEAYFRKTGNEKRAAVARYNLGVAYFETGHFVESRAEYNACLPVFESMGDRLRINGTRMRLAEIALKLGQTDVALHHAAIAIKGAEEIGSLSTLVYLYALTSDIHKKRSDYKKAYEFRLQYEKMKDSISRADLDVKMGELEKKYQSETQAIKLEELKAKNDLAERDRLLAEKKVREQRSFQVFLLGLSVLIILIAFQMHYRYMEKRRHNVVLQEKNELIQKSLNEKELLLNEIHHRVKNNLQFIRSLLNLQARYVHDPHASAVLLDTNNRVQAMALVHQKLYQEDNLKGVEMRGFVNSLVDNLLHSFQLDRSRIGLQTDIDPVNLDIDVANSIGLIINELFTNSIKYAFKGGKPGTISLTLKRENEHLLLRVSDNGPGYPEAANSNESEQFGLLLIRSLSEKLKASLKFYNSGGAVAELHIPFTETKT